MSRKTDEELLAEMKSKIKEDKKKLKQLGVDVEDEDEDEEEESEEEDIPTIKTQKNQPQVVEREINLSLINDKINYIISKLPK